MKMAIIVPGKTRCSICGQIIHADDDAAGLPVLTGNQADPMFDWNDAAFHSACFVAHPQANDILRRLKDQHDKMSTTCCICKNGVNHPDDAYTLPFLVDDPAHPLWSCNYSVFHNWCLAGWDGLGGVLAALESFRDSGAWKGGLLGKIIDELRRIRDMGTLLQPDVTTNLSEKRTRHNGGTQEGAIPGTRTDNGRIGRIPRGE